MVIPPPPANNPPPPANNPPPPANDPPPAGGCHPSYEWVCVPIASDVDCAGGGGDGPVYVQGPVLIVGPDVYRLDGNPKDGIGCEPR